MMCASLSILHLSCFGGIPGIPQISTGKNTLLPQFFQQALSELLGCPWLRQALRQLLTSRIPWFSWKIDSIPKCYNNSAMNIHETIISLGAPKRKRRNARSGSHDTIAGPERNWKGWCFGVMINTNAFTGPRKTHPQVGQYVFPIFHCKGVGCVYISSENAFDKSALLVDRNKLKQYQNWMKTSLGWSSYWAPG